MTGRLFQRVASPGGALAGLALLALAPLDPSGLLYYPDGMRINPALLWRVSFHVALGLAGLLLLLAAGWGLVSLLRPGARPTGAAALLFTLPAGQLAAYASAVLSVYSPAGPAAAVLVLGGLAWLGWRRRTRLDLDPDLRGRLRLLLPGAAMLGFWAGCLWHGPYPGGDSCLVPDITYYAGVAQTLAEGPWPICNLLFEGDRLGLVASFPPMVTAMLLPLPGFDAILWQSASTTVLYAGTMGALWLAWLSANPGGYAARAPWLVAVLAASACRHASWIVTSPPVAHTIPLVFPLAWCLLRAPRDWRLAPACLAALLPFCYIGKITAFVQLGAWCLAALVFALAGQASRRTTWLILAAALAGVATLGAFFLSWWWPMMQGQRDLGPEMLVWYHRWRAEGLGVLRHGAELLTTASAEGGYLLLLGAALAWRKWLLALAGTAAAAVYFCYPWLFYAVPLLFTLMVLIELAVDPVPPPRCARLLLAAGALLRWAHAMGIDPAGAFWPLLFGLVMAVHFARPGLPGRARHAAAWAGVALLVVLVGGGYPVSSLSRQRNPPPHRITEAMAEAWAALPRLVDRSTLVYTNQTGREAETNRGWNNYPPFGRRQLFLGGWMQTSLRFRLEDRERVLRANADVLAGRLAPLAGDLASKYRQAAAVLEKPATMPPGARLLFENSGFLICSLSNTLSP